MNKKIAIIKDGYDIMRIIEGNSDGEKCDFKICFMNGDSNFDIYYMKLFSRAKKLEFDKNKKWEITYHKATSTKPTKIHLKNKEESEYITLPLKELLDPDVNTEIPIPLFKIIIPDGILKNKYKPKKEHRIIDISGNNVVEIFLTKSGMAGSNVYDKWSNIELGLMGNAMEFYATNNPKYMGLNIKCTFINKKSPEERIVHNLCTLADITDDIGIRVNTVNIPNMNKLNNISVLFIENAAYLAFLAGGKIYTEDYKDGQLIYKKDIENEKYFSESERKKWNFYFQKNFKKANSLIKKYKH